MKGQNRSIQNARASISPGQRVYYVTELKHTRCARMHNPMTKGQSIKCIKGIKLYVTELEHTRCSRLEIETKGILCNKTRAYKMHNLRTKDTYFRILQFVQSIFLIGQATTRCTPSHFMYSCIQTIIIIWNTW